MPDIGAWGIQEWASVGTILAPIIGLLGVVPVLYPDFLRRDNRVRRGEGDYLGLAWVQGGESFRRSRRQRQARLVRSLAILGTTLGVYGILGDYSGLPVVSDVSSLASLAIYVTLAIIIIGMAIRVMVKSGVLYRGMERRKQRASLLWCFGVVAITYFLVEYLALFLAILVFAWKRWVLQDGGAVAPWNYIAGFWASVITVGVLLAACSLALRVASIRTQRRARTARSHIAAYRQAPSLTARSGTPLHETAPAGVGISGDRCIAASSSGMRKLRTGPYDDRNPASGK